MTRVKKKEETKKFGWDNKLYFGKYHGDTLYNVYRKDLDYFRWLIHQGGIKVIFFDKDASKKYDNLDPRSTKNYTELLNFIDTEEDYSFDEHWDVF